MLPSSRTYGWWLALLRVYAGLFWLSHGILKFTQSRRFLPPAGYMEGFLQHAAANTGGFYHTFLVDVVIPHPGAFAELARLGEVLAGCSLLLGLWTRLGGVVGAFLALNYLLAKGGAASFDAVGSIEAAAFALSFVHVLLPTGRILGIDALLGRRRTVQPPIAAEFVEEPPAPPPIVEE